MGGHVHREGKAPQSAHLAAVVRRREALGEAVSISDTLVFLWEWFEPTVAAHALDVHVAVDDDPVDAYTGVPQLEVNQEVQDRDVDIPQRQHECAHRHHILDIPLHPLRRGHPVHTTTLSTNYLNIRGLKRWSKLSPRSLDTTFVSCTCTSCPSLTHGAKASRSPNARRFPTGMYMQDD